MLLLPGVIVSIQAWSNYSQRALESLGGGKGRKSGDNATGWGGAGPAPAVHQGLRAAHPPPRMPAEGRRSREGPPPCPHQGQDTASRSFPKPATQRDLTSSSLMFRASFPNLSLKKNLDRAKFRPITLKCSHIEKSKVPRAKTEEGRV